MLPMTSRNNDIAFRIKPNLKLFKGFPNLFPYLSVFFILLFFFMIGTNFVPVQGIPVTLPQTAGEFTYAAKNLIVTVDRNGDIFFHDTRIENTDKELLKRRIAAVRLGYSRQKGKRDSLIIRMDSSAPNDRLLTLLSIAKEMDLNAIVMTQSTNSTDTTTIKGE
ncbi:MAG: hypothetical protein E7038_02250 [Lentisphaerae bacterium]|nr:hypothetical protein [Lentisphaerota bacterium]